MSNNRFLREAISVGDQLLRSAERNNHGLSWKTMISGADHKIVQRTVETLYSGVSGIALFLIELYKQTNNKKYLLAARGALAWVEWRCDMRPQTDNYALLTGRMGIAYVFLQLYNATNEKKYLQKALKIAMSSSSFLQGDHLKEYISGNAGALCGLLHLHAASQEPRLLKIIDAYVQVILRSVRLDRNGVWWDSRPYTIRPLCGFSHGTSGVGFVLLELGRYLNNPAFYGLAEQAFAYENNYFDSKTGNWPDFRLPMWKAEQIAEFEEAYKDGRLDVFNQAADVNAWCHGAAGIVLVRMRAYELTGKKVYLDDAKRALDRVKREGHPDRRDTFCLCHGVGGNAESLIESYRLFGDAQDLLLARHWGESAIRQRRKLGRYLSGLGVAANGEEEDDSLFNGIAGIGYFFLRLHDPRKTPSILAPRLTTTLPRAVVSQSLPSLSVNLIEIQKCLVKSAFPLSMELAERYVPEHTERQFKKAGALNSSREFSVRLMQGLSNAVPVEHRQSMTEALLLERLKLELESQRPSNGLLYVEKRLQRQKTLKLLQLSDITFLRSTVRLTEYSRLFAAEKQGHTLLKLTVVGVEEQKISPFCYVVLASFFEEDKISRVVYKIARLYGIKNESGEKVLQEKVISQVRMALAYDVLNAL